jgi:hypothetical protein
MHAALVTNHANHASAIVATQEVTELFCVTVRSHRTRPPWSIRMDESHWTAHPTLVWMSGNRKLCQAKSL